MEEVLTVSSGFCSIGDLKSDRRTAGSKCAVEEAAPFLLSEGDSLLYASCSYFYFPGWLLAACCRWVFVE